MIEVISELLIQIIDPAMEGTIILPLKEVLPATEFDPTGTRIAIRHQDNVLNRPMEDPVPAIESRCRTRKEHLSGCSVMNPTGVQVQEDLLVILLEILKGLPQHRMYKDQLTGIQVVQVFKDRHLVLPEIQVSKDLVEAQTFVGQQAVQIFEVHQEEVSLSDDEWETLVTWVDANAPYYSTYFQYFDSAGELLPEAIRVRIKLDPPFATGEKAFRLADPPLAHAPDVTVHVGQSLAR